MGSAGAGAAPKSGFGTNHHRAYQQRFRWRCETPRIFSLQWPVICLPMVHQSFVAGATKIERRLVDEIPCGGRWGVWVYVIPPGVQLVAEVGASVYLDSL
jgi:hypothetical protein